MIKAYDGQVVHNGMIDALVEQEIQRQLEQRQREAALREAAMAAEISRMDGELYMARRRESRVFAEKIAEARAKYHAEPIRQNPVAWVLTTLYVWSDAAFQWLLGEMRK